MIRQIIESDRYCIYSTMAAVNRGSSSHLRKMYPEINSLYAKKPLGEVVYTIDFVVVRSLVDDYIVVYKLPRYSVHDLRMPFVPAQMIIDTRRLIQVLKSKRVDCCIKLERNPKEV